PYTTLFRSFSHASQRCAPDAARLGGHAGKTCRNVWPAGGLVEPTRHRTQSQPLSQALHSVKCHADLCGRITPMWRTSLKRPKPCGDLPAWHLTEWSACD